MERIPTQEITIRPPRIDGVNSTGQTETFFGLYDGPNRWKIPTIPILIRNLSFGDVMARREDNNGWKIVEKSRYTTILVVPIETLRNPAGDDIIASELRPLRTLDPVGVVYQIYERIRSFAVLPHYLDAFTHVLDSGEDRYWNWAILCDRRNG